MIDSHCHLADEGFDADRDAVLQRAREAGLTTALCIVSAGHDGETERALWIRERWPDVRFSTGVHPHNARSFDGQPAGAAALTRESMTRVSACAIGEIGLDYHYDFSPPPVQRDVFAVQLALARELGRPVVIHTREAADHTFEILASAGGGTLAGVFHCFTGDAAMARRALDIGFYISFAGIVSFPRAGELRDVARLVPADRLLVETDSPYLAPVPNRGKRNEPAFVTHVIDVLARVRGEEPRTVESRTTENFVRLFG